MNQLAVQTPTLATDQLENSEPQQVFLFSGHMVDAPDRSPARFPPEKEPFAAAAIAKLLDELGAGADDVAICSAACGGDLLFAESCLKRNVRVEIYLPFVEENFSKIPSTSPANNGGIVFLRSKGGPGLAHHAAGVGTYARAKRSLCQRQSVDARSSARVRPKKTPLHLPLGWSRG